MPLDQVKVVILGQDPYPKRGQAIGYSFAVSETTPIPASLAIIAQEIEQEGLKSGFYDSDIPHWRTLEFWREDGVFLLNTALTVEANKKGSHIKYWKEFTEEVIKILAIHAKPIWLFWGAEAAKYADIIRQVEVKTEDMNIGDNPILIASHPAAETYRENAGFYGCGHFIKTNEILKSRGLKEISW